jgi:hypothetical protein
LPRGLEQHAGLGHQDDEKEYGGLVKVMESATSRPRYPPAVAFSPDGTKLASTVMQPIRLGSRPGSDSGLILVWAAPK